MKEFPKNIYHVLRISAMNHKEATSPFTKVIEKHHQRYDRPVSVVVYLYILIHICHATGANGKSNPCHGNPYARSFRALPRLVSQSYKVHEFTVDALKCHSSNGRLPPAFYFCASMVTRPRRPSFSLPRAPKAHLFRCEIDYLTVRVGK